jgi:di/tricarboxylate transporter
MTEPVVLTPQIAWVLGVLALTVFLFVSEIIRVDVVAITIMVLLGVTGLVSGNEIFNGFASNAVISIIAVMIIGAGLDKTGAMNAISRPIIKIAGSQEGRLIAIISSAVGFISSFMQNVGAAALFLPAVRRIATRTNIPLSRLLMPMGFCAILGGTVTLIGSSPLILLNDLIASSNKTLPAGVEPIKQFGLFEVTPIGIALITVGIGYFVIFGRLVLPAISGSKSDSTSTFAYLEKHYGFRGDIFEVRVLPDSPLAGTTMDYLRQQSKRTINVVARDRENDVKIAPSGDANIQVGDVLGLVGKEEDIKALAETMKLQISPVLSRFAEALAPGSAGIAEIVIAPRASVIGRTTAELQFRRKYRASVLAVYSGEKIITENIRDVKLDAGDALLVHTSWKDLLLLDENRDFIIMSDYPREEAEMRPQKLKFAVVFFGIALGLVLFTKLKLSVALMTGAIGMILSGVLKIDEAYDSVDWRTVFLLASLIPLGLAVDQSGTATWIAQNLLAIIGDVHEVVLLAVVAILATVFTLVMSNVGATVLLVPLAIEIAIGAEADPRIFALAVGIGTSNSFLLPTHQVNALIMGPGGYRNRDFIRAGGIMTVLFLVVLVVMLSLFY